MSYNMVNTQTDHDELMVKVFNSTLCELIDLSTMLLEKSRESLYAEVLINYLQKDHAKLGILLDRIIRDTSLADHKILSAITHLRYKLMMMSYDASDIELVLNIIENYPLWKGDVYSVAGFAYAKLDNQIKAKILFKNAYNALNAIKAKHRALHALQNVIVSESNIYPDKKLLGEYQHLMNKAMEFGYEAVAAGACLNLSREFQKNGAIRTALVKIGEAEALVKNDCGTLLYFLIKSHKCHLLIQLLMWDQARLVLDELSCSNHKEIMENVKLLKALIERKDDQNIDVNLEIMADSWKERIRNGDYPKLGQLEENLLEFIAKGPKKKNDVIKHLYGEMVDYFTLENRFKNLIARCRKKIPDLIICDDGVYRISDEYFLKEIKNAL